jgi:hypothetical protein
VEPLRALQTSGEAPSLEIATNTIGIARDGGRQAIGAACVSRCRASARAIDFVRDILKDVCYAEHLRTFGGRWWLGKQLVAVPWRGGRWQRWK